ncbi:GGDEF domain-containing protein [Sporomusa malonica]|uniref:Diguanylate cyclase (GGDEF) domain-containing protein n=1 Tax=Sporomusa malonica TaxID=112901 RepID=A0A1W2D5H4_9FIRM|nr:GGDEF domain-containing protein [Sporomusa malonica]SMC92278.1 diguanylate cyclase (GGDEF) domain-containing protein [Sporomusa malonica]
MKYTGRITGLIIMLIAIVAVRVYAYIYLDYSFSHLPIPGVIGLCIAFWAGKQYDKVKFYSEKDSLTGFYNRRFVDTLFPSLLAQMDRRNEKLSVAILDCDRFKDINDRYGHKKGDLVLQELSALLFTSIRKSDIVARWGGDEFLIIAPYADEEDIKVIISRFKNKLQELSQNIQIDISVSSGYAIYPSDAKTLDDLINIADSRMYGYKNTARYC